MDFQYFPTPEALVKRAWAKFQNREFVRVLEPSAGMGHLAKGRPNHSASDWHRRPDPVDCIEIDVSKHAQLRSDGFTVVGLDFLQFNGAGAIYSHVIMNPPFADGAKHVLKAWDLLYDGEIVAIVNAETIRNPFSKERELLVRLVEEHGDVEFIEGAFAVSEAERKTDVEVALVYLKKTAPFGKTLMDGVFDGLAQEGHNGLDAGYQDIQALAIPANFIENSVLTFNAAVRAMRKSVFAEARAARCESLLGQTMAQMNAEKEGKKSFDSSLEQVRRELHKRYDNYKDRAWAGILRSTDVTSRLSSAAQKRLESEFETIKQLEFTVSNVYGFLGGLIAKQGEISIEMCCDVFDEISKYHSDNSHFYMGWKSNDAHRTAGMRIKTTRFVLPGNATESWNRGLPWDSMQRLRDFDKVFAMLDSKQSPEIGLADVFDNRFDELRGGERVSASYFDVRYYPKRGTIHFFARDKKLVERLNRLVGRHRQWLPPEGERVSDAFWLQYDKAEDFDKEVRTEVLRGERWGDPFWKMQCGYGDERKAAADKVAGAIAKVLEKHGIDPNAMLEAPRQESPALPLLAAAA